MAKAVNSDADAFASARPTWFLAPEHFPDFETWVDNL